MDPARPIEPLPDDQCPVKGSTSDGHSDFASNTTESAGDSPATQDLPKPNRSANSVTPSRLVGAAMLGVGAILQPKHDPKAHWSESPKVVLVQEELGEDLETSGQNYDLRLIWADTEEPPG